MSKDALLVVSLREGNAWKIEAARPFRDGEFARLFTWPSMDNDVLKLPTTGNREDEAPFCSSHFRAIPEEMVDGCGLLVNIVVDGAEGGGK